MTIKPIGLDLRVVQIDRMNASHVKEMASDLKRGIFFAILQDDAQFSKTKMEYLTQMLQERVDANLHQFQLLTRPGTREIKDVPLLQPDSSILDALYDVGINPLIPDPYCIQGALIYGSRFIIDSLVYVFDPRTMQYAEKSAVEPTRYPGRRT